MKDSFRNNALVTVGAFAIATAALFNEWTLAKFSPHIRVFFSRREIWGIDAILMTIGFLLIRYRSRIRVREIAFSAVTFMFFLLLLEGGLRLFYFVKNEVTTRERDFSSYLGWATKPDESWRREYKRYGEVVYTTTKFGFRRFGDVNTKKTKIFVIGDSFTQCARVSDGGTYYDYLHDHDRNIDIFAYGCGGYGSLQEYMVLNTFFDMIKPDIILWQFCDNDLFDNSYELASASLHGQHMTRPYYENGRIEWLYPKRNFGFLYGLVQSSYLLRILDIKLDILKGELVGPGADNLSLRNPLVEKAMSTTSEIMSLVKKRAGDVPVVAFLATDNPKWLGDAFPDICKRSAIHYVQGISEAVQNAKLHGVVVDGSPYDSHWNNTGNAIAGRMLLSYLIKHKMINSKDHETNDRRKTQ